MTKTELIDQIADDTDLTKGDGKVNGQHREVLDYEYIPIHL